MNHPTRAPPPPPPPQQLAAKRLIQLQSRENNKKPGPETFRYKTAPLTYIFMNLYNIYTIYIYPPGLPIILIWALSCQLTFD